jgi:hypothetical protein
MGQLLRKGVAELFDAAEATIDAKIAANKAELAALKAALAVELDVLAALEIEMAEKIRERELKASAADAEDPDAVIAAAMRERKRLLAVEPGSEPGDDSGDAGPTKNADTKPAGLGEK